LSRPHRPNSDATQETSACPIPQRPVRVTSGLRGTRCGHDAVRPVALATDTRAMSTRITRPPNAIAMSPLRPSDTSTTVARAQQPAHAGPADGDSTASRDRGRSRSDFCRA
jgi:hypothetical protein